LNPKLLQRHVQQQAKVILNFSENSSTLLIKALVVLTQQHYPIILKGSYCRTLTTCNQLAVKQAYFKITENNVNKMDKSKT